MLKTSRSLAVGEIIDQDLELSISIRQVFAHIKRNEAKKLADHLTAVFDLGNPNTPDSSEEG